MRNKFKEWLTRHLSGCVRWPCTALAAIALLAAPLTSQAHARLVRSNPTDGAVLPNSPRQIELWFNELLEDGFNVVEVFPATSTPGQQRVNLAKNKAIVDRKE